MRIGIVPYLNSNWGGVYQYSLTVLRALQESVNAGMRHNFVVFTDQPNHISLSGLDRRYWRVRSSEPISYLTNLRRVVGEGPHRDLWRLMRRRIAGMAPASSEVQVERQYNPEAISVDYKLQKWFRHCGVELMVYSSPYQYPLEAALPFILAVHDLQHRVHPEFLEVSANGEWMRREYFCRNGARYATLLLADSEIGRQDILNYYGEYGATEDRVKVLPFMSAASINEAPLNDDNLNVRTSIALPERYMFYPAQFWPHKNHAILVRALGWVKSHTGMDIHLVFCGANTGLIRGQTFQDVMTLAMEQDVTRQIHYLGYVKDSQMAGLYKEAVALVMPTHFGPTNIPIIEAWALGCPVLTSDVRGIREQVGDAGLLVDPCSVEGVAGAMTKLWTDSRLRQDLVRRGMARQEGNKPQDFQRRLALIIEEGVLRVQQGKTPQFPMVVKRMRANAAGNIFCHSS